MCSLEHSEKNNANFNCTNQIRVFLDWNLVKWKGLAQKMVDYLKNGCSIIVSLMVKTKETQGKIHSNDFVMFKGEKFSAKWSLVEFLR